MNSKPFLSLVLYGLLIVLCSCSSSTKIPAVEPANQKPEWVRQYPIDRYYFVGISSAPIMPGSAQHISQARDAALAEIASSITVQIISESESRIREEEHLFSHTFEERISSFAKQDLDGFELVDTWEGANHYWVYYRLSRELYRRQIEEKIRLATALAKDMLKNAESEISKGHHAQAMRYQLQAYNNLGDFIGYGIETDVNDENVFLENYIWRNTQSRASELKVEFVPSRVEGAFLQGLSQPVKIKVLSKYNSNIYKPVQSIPLIVSFERGNGQITENVVTGADGTVELSVSRISSPLRQQIIIVKPDIKAIAGSLEEVPAVADLINNISLPEARLTVNLKAVTFCLDYTDRGEYNDLIKNSSDGKIRSSLSDRGFEFSSDINRCNYTLKFDASLRRGTVIQNIHTAFCSATVYFISDQGVELMSFSVNNVSGADLSFETAKEKAIQNAVDRLVKRISDDLF